LQGAIDAFAAPARLRRVAEDVFDAQALERAADLGEFAPIGAGA
jgi:hypothetical protein